jgi:GT2 family glycosyltransferase
MYKIATITTAYNQFQDFNNWKSHYKQYCDEISYHIIVDNNSSDEYKKLYKQEFKNSIILELSEGKGVTGGYNEAIKYIQRNLEVDFILFIMQDMNIPGNGVSILADCLNLNQEIGVIAPVNLYENKSNIIREHGGSISKNDFSVKKHYLDQELNSKIPEMLEVDFLCGGNYMFRADIFNKIGLFDEKIFMYGDEVDILIRVANYGYKVFSTTKTVCYHEHIYEKTNGKKVRFPSSNALFFTGRNYFYLIKKYGNYKNIIFGFIIAIYKSTRFFLASLIKSGSVTKPHYLIKGYFKGIFYN